MREKTMNVTFKFLIIFTLHFEFFFFSIFDMIFGRIWFASLWQRNEIMREIKMEKWLEL